MPEFRLKKVFFTSIFDMLFVLPAWTWKSKLAGLTRIWPTLSPTWNNMILFDRFDLLSPLQSPACESQFLLVGRYDWYCRMLRQKWKKWLTLWKALWRLWRLWLWCMHCMHATSAEVRLVIRKWFSCDLGLFENRLHLTILCSSALGSWTAPTGSNWWFGAVVWTTECVP